MLNNLSVNKIWINLFSRSETLENKLFFLLRFGVMGCFVGHGMWGILGKTAWLSFFEVFFFSEPLSYTLMPAVGIMDILVGLSIFILPTRAMIFWAAVWTVFTAALRPSAGMGMSEFFERAGNYGVPIALFYGLGLKLSFKNAFQIVRVNDVNWQKRLHGMEKILRWSLFLLLAGHGGLAFFKESELIGKHLMFVGIPVDSMTLKIFGLFEMILGTVVLLFPRTNGLIWFVLFYKLLTESLHPIVGQSRDVLETIERMGDYIIPLLLIFIYAHKPVRRKPYAL